LDADLDKKNARKLPKAERNKPRAVMVDIDETVLDNSPAQAYAIKNRLPFNLKDWYAWGEMRKARAIPGAVEFLNCADSKGVRVFFVSNRDEVQKQATIDNLKNAGFSQCFRRQCAAENKGHQAKRLVARSSSQNTGSFFFMGDNLDDHSNVFRAKIDSGPIHRG
jgi:5'-nucleotidase (lipoprotein e(P4) family)